MRRDHFLLLLKAALARTDLAKKASKFVQNRSMFLLSSEHLWASLNPEQQLSFLKSCPSKLQDPHFFRSSEDLGRAKKVGKKDVCKKKAFVVFAAANLWGGTKVLFLSDNI